MLSSGCSLTRLILHDSVSSLLDVKQQSLQYCFLILRKIILVYLNQKFILVIIMKQEINSRNQKNAFWLIIQQKHPFKWNFVRSVF